MRPAPGACGGTTLGFWREKTRRFHPPRLFSGLDVDAFEGALRNWAKASLAEAEQVNAIDGKGLRGIHGEELPEVRSVAAYAAGASLVLAQKGVKSWEKGVELRPAPQLLSESPLAGGVG